jgi:16S rRNA processing protein RimM
METIPLANCTKIGYLQKPHGVRGEVVLFFEEEFEESVEFAVILFVKIEGLLVPFFIEDEGLRIKSARQAYIKFKWVDSGEKAREFSGCEVYLKTVDIIKTEEKFNLQMLIGFQVLNSQKLIIGKVAEVNDYAGNVVLSVDFEGSEVLIPFNSDMVEILDTDNKILQMQIPDGLFDADEN